MKPTLVGMNNPPGRELDPPLVPWPDGCSGHRLWKMMNAMCGASIEEYMEFFDRVNLCRHCVWTLPEARTRAMKITLKRDLKGSQWIILGNQAWSAFRFPGPRPDPCGHLRWSGRKWHFLPHPSGLNTWYNKLENRTMVGRFLAGILRDEIQSRNYEAGTAERDSRI